MGDNHYFSDDPVEIIIDGRSTPHISIISLPPDGTVQWIYPRYAPLDPSGLFEDPAEIQPRTPLSFSAIVTPPFGADHIVVFQTDTKNEDLRSILMRHDGQPKIRELWEDLQLALQDQRFTSISRAFYTREEP